MFSVSMDVSVLNPALSNACQSTTDKRPVAESKDWPGRQCIHPSSRGLSGRLDAVYLSVRQRLRVAFGKVRSYFRRALYSRPSSYYRFDLFRDGGANPPPHTATRHASARWAHARLRAAG